ncbi:MAG: DUF1788 domain-containing protein [Desulfamplus sp.]|nr:DUF1788 domain-containing protein [Desulfamplus sp.]
MSSLKADFNELMERIRRGRELSYASFEPIFYLVFHPDKMVEVKRETTAWKAKLSNEGWDVHLFSISDNIADIFRNAKLRKIWIAGDKKAPHEWKKTNQSLANALEKGELQTRLEDLLQSVSHTKNAIVLVTDLEALHPYMRIGSIEGQLQGKFQVPTLFFYPGVRTGNSQLKFLGFYPEDGNYRSVHVGG